ncbi:MAG: hypothetical protein RKL24_12230, partial [Defluviicoccus sp.]|nr:hypothetical protein [Defluviicoccus sp.]
MFFIDWFHECGHAALELAALTSSGVLHALVHGTVYGTPVMLVLSVTWIGVVFATRVKARRVLRERLDEDLHR